MTAYEALGKVLEEVKTADGKHRLAILLEGVGDLADRIGTMRLDDMPVLVPSGTVLKMIGAYKDMMEQP